MGDQFYAAAFERCPVPMALLSVPDYRFVIANPACTELCSLFGIHDFLGHTVSEVYWGHKGEQHIRFLDLACETGEEQAVMDFPITVNVGGVPQERYFAFRYCPVRSPDGQIRSILTTAYETTARIHALKFEHQNAVLRGINRVFGAALSAQTEEELGRTCLAVAEELTGSKFGFIDEVNEQGLLDILAISHPGWSACTMGDNLGKPRTLTGFAIRGGFRRILFEREGLLTNDLPSHPDSVGLPPGHPPIKAFLGVPLSLGGGAPAMVGVANREGGYRPKDLEALRSLSGVIEQAFAHRRLRKTLDAERQRAEQQAAEFQALFNALPLGVAVIEEPRTIVLANPDLHRSWQSLTGLAQDGQSVEMAVTPLYADGTPMPPDDTPSLRALRDDFVSDYPYMTVEPDGCVHHRKCTTVPLPAMNGKRRVMRLTRDVTEEVTLRVSEKQARLAAERSVAEWQAVFDLIPDTAAVIDESGRMVWRNRKHIEIFGERARASPPTIGWLSVKHDLRTDGSPADVNDLAWKRALSGEPALNRRGTVRDKNGELMHRLVSAVILPTPEDQSKRVLVLGRDITELVKLQEAEQESLQVAERAVAQASAERDRLQALLNSMTDEVWFADAQGNPTAANQAAVDGVGFDDLQDTQRPLGVLHDELEVLEPDGSRRTLDESPVWRALQGEHVDGTEIVRHRKTGQQRYRQYSMSPVRAGDGTIAGAVSVVRDITEQRLLQEALERAQHEKDEARSRFLSVMAHEVRNPMATILATLNLMELRLATGKPVRDLITTAKKETSRAAGLLTEVIDAFRAQEDQLPMRFSTVNLTEVLSDAVEPFVATLDGSRVRRVVDPTRQVHVMGDARRLSDVFRNLMQNALKYSPQETRVDILLEVDNDAAVVKVVDRGIGISPEDQEHIFEPFFRASNATLDEDGNGGVGLGLYLCKLIVEKHNGEIWANSELGRGSTFFVRIPVLPGEVGGPEL